MEIKQTQRGFDFTNFKDSNLQECSLQKSSLVVPKIWLGIDNTGPEITDINGKKNSGISARMHLSRKQVLELIPYLVGFVKTGELKKARKWKISDKLSKFVFTVVDVGNICKKSKRKI